MRKISPDEKLRRALRGGCMTAIVSPEGAHVGAAADRQAAAAIRRSHESLGMRLDLIGQAASG